MLRKLPLLLVLLCILSAYYVYQGRQVDRLRCSDCNVILIGIDALRADHLSSYGYTKIQTPNIDSLAKNGVLFKENYSQSINTTPSFMSIFTSLYPTDHGLLFTPSPSDPELNKIKLFRINDKITTLPQILKANNYQTQGFITSLAIASNFGFSKGFDQYINGNIPLQRERFLDFLRSGRKGKFFAFFHDLSTHSPYDTLNKGDESKTNDFFSRYNVNSPADIKTLNNLYDNDIKGVDDYIGLLINILRQEKLMDKTIIVFMADHGDEIGDHGVLGHIEFYNEVEHVPLIMYIPGLKKPVVVNQVTRSIDVMPTILDILGIKTNTPMRGISLVPVIASPEKNLNLPVISIMGTGKSIISNGFKFIDQTSFQLYLKKSKTQELYDLQNDPKEKANIIGKNIPVETELTNFYTNTINDLNFAKPPEEIKDPIFQKNTINQLRNLGY